ncbi:MAG: hypothetical protein SVX43_19995, partial [Cyanobacteriota bacterium]|nr:hypothetical protein [Cyanobacteriota bacterium]
SCPPALPLSIHACNVGAPTVKPLNRLPLKLFLPLTFAGAIAFLKPNFDRSLSLNPATLPL